MLNCFNVVSYMRAEMVVKKKQKWWSCSRWKQPNLSCLLFSGDYWQIPVVLLIFVRVISPAAQLKLHPCKLQPLQALDTSCRYGFTAGAHERIIYAHHLPILASHSLNLTDFIVIRHRTPAHQGHQQPSYAATAKHALTSALLLLDTADHQFHFQKLPEDSFNDTILPCFSRLLNYSFLAFPKLSFLLCPFLRNCMPEPKGEDSLSFLLCWHLISYLLPNHMPIIVKSLSV